MKIQYRKLFLKDLEKLRGQPVHRQAINLVFTTLPEASRLKDVSNVKAMKGYPNRYRIRIGNYRVGVEVHGDKAEVMRVLHRREFYRYFP